MRKSVIARLLRQKVIEAPEPIRHPCRHRGSNPHFARSPAVIEVSDMQVDCRLHVLEFLAEAQGKAGESPHERADCEVVSFDVARAYFARFYFATPHGAYRADHLRRRVDHAGVFVFLYDGSELRVGTESQVNRFGVRWKAVAGDLDYR